MWRRCTKRRSLSRSGLAGWPRSAARSRRRARSLPAKSSATSVGRSTAGRSTTGPAVALLFRLNSRMRRHCSPVIGPSVRAANRARRSTHDRGARRPRRRPPRRSRPPSRRRRSAPAPITFAPVPMLAPLSIVAPRTSPARSPIVTQGTIIVARSGSPPGRRPRAGRARCRRRDEPPPGRRSRSGRAPSPAGGRAAGARHPEGLEARLYPVERLGQEGVALPGQAQALRARSSRPRNSWRSPR